MINTKLLSKLSQIYKCGIITPIRRAKFGTSSRNYILLINNKKYFLKNYESSKHKKINKLINVYKILEYTKVNPRIIIPIKNTEGEYFTSLGDRYYVIYPFVKGSPKLLLKKEDIHQVCEILKNFNSITRFLNHSLFSNNTFKPSFIRKSFLAELKIDPENELSMLKCMGDLKLKNDVLLHGDTDFTNFLFASRLEALLDIDECFFGDKREEVILTTLNFCLNRNGILFDKAKALEFVKNFGKFEFSVEIIDYFVYKHVLSSFNTFSLKKMVAEGKSEIVLKYFVKYFNTYKLNRERIYEVFGAK